MNKHRGNVSVLLLIFVASAGHLPACSAEQPSERTPREFIGCTEYENTFESFSPDITVEELRHLYGTHGRRCFGRGNYKIEHAAGSRDTVWYLWEPNKEYILLRGESRLLVNDFSKPLYLPKSYEKLPTEATRLGYDLELIVIRFENGMTYHEWYAPALPIDVTHLKQIRFGGIGEFWDRTRAVTLEVEQRHPKFLRRTVVTRILPMDLPDGTFDLPNLPQVPWEERDSSR
jgi:hypothetical protein